MNDFIHTRRKRKGKGAQRRARSGGRGNQKASKALPKAPPPLPARPSATKPPITTDSQLEMAEESSGQDKEHASSNQGAEEEPPSRKGGAGETGSARCLWRGVCWSYPESDRLFDVKLPVERREGEFAGSALPFPSSLPLTY